MAGTGCLTRMNRALIAFLAGIFLAGCAADGRNLRPGVSDAAAVRSDMGAPAEVLPLPQGGEVWFYPKGLGRQTFRVELGTDGKLRSVEQVLDEKVFDRIIKGKTTRDELRRLLGPPFYVWQLRNETVWEYRYEWGPHEPWTLRVGIGPDNIVTGQFRHQELDAAPEGRS